MIFRTKRNYAGTITKSNDYPLPPSVIQGAICFGMLNPNKLAAHNVAYNIIGLNSNSVCCKKGNAGRLVLLAFYPAPSEQKGKITTKNKHTTVSQEENDDIVAEGGKVQGVAQKQRYPRTTVSRAWHG